MCTVWVESVSKMGQIYQRQTCYFVTYSSEDCGRRGHFKYMNEYQIFRESLNIIAPFLSFRTPLLYPSFPSLLPRFPVSLTPHCTPLSPLSPLFISLIEHLTRVIPPTLFSHIPTGGSRGCMSAECLWLTTLLFLLLKWKRYWVWLGNAIPSGQRKVLWITGALRIAIPSTPWNRRY